MRHKNKISMKSLYPTKISFFCLWKLLGQNALRSYNIYLKELISNRNRRRWCRENYLLRTLPGFHFTSTKHDSSAILFLFVVSKRSFATTKVHKTTESYLRLRYKQCLVLTIMSMMSSVKFTFWSTVYVMNCKRIVSQLTNTIRSSKRQLINNIAIFAFGTSTINPDNFPQEFHNFIVTLWWHSFYYFKTFSRRQDWYCFVPFSSNLFQILPRLACHLHVRTEFPRSADVISSHGTRVPKIILMQLYNYTHRLTSHAMILHILL